jgi:SAM-dependent methyltransferase
MASIVDDRGYNQGFEWTPTQEARIERRARAILDEVELRAGDRVMEIGCGTGELAHLIADGTTASVLGVDLCQPFVDQANERFASDRLRFVQADVSTHEGFERVGGSGFTAVVGNGILHHLYYTIDDALAGMRRLLAPGGRLVFWEPNVFNPYVFAIFKLAPLRKLAKLEPDEMAFSPMWITKHLHAAGFVDVEVSYRDFLVPIVPARLVGVVSRVGDVVEQIPGLKRLAQSLFVCATAPRPCVR